MLDVLAITTAPMTTLDRLPLHILITILDYSWNMEDYLAIRQTCKRFKTALSYNSFITPKRFEDFQKYQRQFYQQLARFIPKDSKWDLSNNKVRGLIDLLQRKTRNYNRSTWHLVGNSYESITKEMTEQDQEWERMERLCSDMCGFHEYCILGHRRVTRIYDDALRKIANTNFAVLDLTKNSLDNNSIIGFFNVLKRNTTSIKLNKLILNSNNLTDLSCLVDIQDLFDDCYLYLSGNRWRHNQYQGIIIGVARVFGINQHLNCTKARRIFHNNKIQPATICHSDGDDYCLLCSCCLE